MSQFYIVPIGQPGVQVSCLLVQGYKVAKSPTVAFAVFQHSEIMNNYIIHIMMDNSRRGMDFL